MTSPRRNVVFMIAIDHEHKMDYFEYSSWTWSAWCAKHDVIYYVLRKPFVDLGHMPPYWQRYHALDILAREEIPYAQVAMVDADTMVRWDCPDFFGLTDQKLGVVLDGGHITWIADHIEAYSGYFPGIPLKWYEYFNAGFIVFNDRHRALLQRLLDFYTSNSAAIQLLEQSRFEGAPDDQTPFNFIVRERSEEAAFLPPVFNLSCLDQRNLLWKQRFIEFGYIWHFNSFPKQARLDTMRSTWEAIKQHYA